MLRMAVDLSKRWCKKHEAGMRKCKLFIRDMALKPLRSLTLKYLTRSPL